MQQPREISGREEEHGWLVEQHDLDPDWGWTRRVIAGLLADGFTADGVGIPYELRNEAWAVLSPLTEDPEPDPDYEAQYGGSNMDPATMSINTTRGEAMHAVVRYALWVRRGIEGAADGTKRLDRGLDEMPEVRDVLEQHLDPDLESSLAIRAVYGWRFPQLTLIGESWAAHNASRIFPADESLEALRAAAWGAYVVFEKPYDEIVDVLLEQYRHAVRHLTTTPGERWMAGRPDEKLVEHLMMLYWSGKLGLEDSPSLISEFYNIASEELRAYSVEFLTRLLENPEVQISEDVLARLRDLWDFRREVASEACISELKAFAEFFASGQFEKRWALKLLYTALSLTEQVVLDRQVAEYLADCVLEEPLLAVRCLRSTIEATGESWRISVRQAPVRSVLTTAIQGTDEAAQQEARELANRLVARGFSNFQDLAQQDHS